MLLTAYCGSPWTARAASVSPMPFPKFHFRRPFSSARFQVTRCYNVTYQVPVTIRPSRRRRSLHSVIDPYVVRIEFVVDADAQEIVGDAGIEGDRGRRTRRWRWNGRGRSQIEVEVLDLGGPIAGHAAFDAAAGRPVKARIYPIRQHVREQATPV